MAGLLTTTALGAVAVNCDPDHDRDQHTSTTLVSSSNIAILGQSVTFTATVSAECGRAVPAGTVFFKVNGIAVASEQLDGSGVAVYSTDRLPIASLQIKAVYKPAHRSRFEGSASPVLVESVYATLPQSKNVFFKDSAKTLGSGFSHPDCLKVDSNGNVFVADTGNHALKEILASSGYTTTITLLSDFQEIASVATDSKGNVFVVDAGAPVVYEVTGDGSVRTFGNQLSQPWGVAVDVNDNVFVADSGNGAVKELTAASGYATIETLNSGLRYPWGVAVDRNENIFVTDVAAHTVNELLASENYATIHPLAQRFFRNPFGVTVDAEDNVFVSDTSYNQIREISQFDNWTTVDPFIAGISDPIGVGVDDTGNLFVADTGNNAVKEISQIGGNFGSANVGGTSPFTISMFFFFDATTTLGSTVVLTGDAPNRDFTDAGTGTCKANTVYPAGDTCTVNVNFTPTQADTRSGRVELLDELGNVLATGKLEGVGVGLP